jgi:ribosomal protein S18 acetylase RimI-like enzyme
MGIKMMDPVTLRPARLDDSGLVARLIYLTMGIEADWLFGQEKGHSTLQVIADLYKQKKNRLSHTLTHLAERNGQLAGLLLSYPGAILSRLDWLTGWCLIKILGMRATARLARIQSNYGDLKEAEPDEYYVSNLAVFPEFQGHGIGTLLMAHAEEMAREAGLHKCSLVVTFGHESARLLYEHLGYKVVRSIPSGHPKVAEGSGGYHRMVKILSPRPDAG